MLTAKQKVILARERKNRKLNHISLEMETSTHFPVLIKLIQMTMQDGGIVAELGSGLFSTPLLHWLCFTEGRRVITYESYKHYFEFAEKFMNHFHEVRFVKDWKEEPFYTEYGIVLIDHSPKKPWTRGDDAIRFADRAQYVVLHDAGENSNPKYGYEKAYKHFKYRYDWTGCLPHTTILSNFHDLEDFHA